MRPTTLLYHNSETKLKECIYGSLTGSYYPWKPKKQKINVAIDFMLDSFF